MEPLSKLFDPSCLFSETLSGTWNLFMRRMSMWHLRNTHLYAQALLNLEPSWNVEGLNNGTFMLKLGPEPFCGRYGTLTPKFGEPEPLSGTCVPSWNLGPFKCGTLMRELGEPEPSRETLNVKLICGTEGMWNLSVWEAWICRVLNWKAMGLGVDALKTRYFNGFIGDRVYSDFLDTCTSEMS